MAELSFVNEAFAKADGGAFRGKFPHNGVSQEDSLKTVCSCKALVQAMEKCTEGTLVLTKKSTSGRSISLILSKDPESKTYVAQFWGNGSFHEEWKKISVFGHYEQFLADAHLIIDDFIDA